MWATIVSGSSEVDPEKGCEWGKCMMIYCRPKQTSILGRTAAGGLSRRFWVAQKLKITILWSTFQNLVETCEMKTRLPEVFGTICCMRTFWIKLFVEQTKNLLRPNYEDKSPVKELDITELKAFNGLIFYSSNFKSNHQDLDFFLYRWNGSWNIFRCIIGKIRFANLLHFLLFDNSRTRYARGKDNPAATIHNSLDLLNQNCSTIYSLGKTTCVYEMFIAFREC